MTGMEQQNFDEAAAWEEARRIASLVGNISSLFSTCIRFLRKDAEQNNVLSSSSLFSLQRLLNSDSFRAPIYYTAEIFKGEDLNKRQGLTSMDLARLFTPEELSILVAMLYLYRRVQKGCDATEWEEMSKNIHLYSSLGGHLGTAIPKIGLGWGLMLGASRDLALGLFLSIDKKKYIQYRRNQKIAKRLYNLEEEQKIWGCNHLHVASLMVQSLGLGGALPRAITTGILAQEEDSELDDDSYRARIAWRWIESLKRTNNSPDCALRGDYYPRKEALNQLLGHAQILNKEGQQCAFLTKGKDDISRQLTPALFAAEVEVDPSDEVTLDDLVDGDAESLGTNEL